MVQPEKKSGEPEDNELREATRRRYELNTYLLVSIGMQSQFQTPTPRRVMEPLPAPNEDQPATIDLHQSIRELIFGNPWYGSKRWEMIDGYIARELGGKVTFSSLTAPLAEPDPLDQRRWQLTERGEQMLENKLEQHERDPDQYPLIPDILDNIRAAHSSQSKA